MARKVRHQVTVHWRRRLGGSQEPPATGAAAKLLAGTVGYVRWSSKAVQKEGKRFFKKKNLEV